MVTITLAAAKQLVAQAASKLERRARGMVRRAVLNALDNSGGLAIGSLELTEDELVDSVEILNPPGLSFRPEGAECIVLAVGGDPSNLVAIPFARGKRLEGDDLEAGEAALFIGVAGQVVRLKANGDVVITPGVGGKVYLGEDGATKKVALADDVDARLSAIQAAYDAHVHPGVMAGPGSTSPTPSLIGPLAPTAATLIHGK
jgi:phage gp45-like